MVYLFLRDPQEQEIETRLTSKNKEASKQVLVKENNDPEEGRGGVRGGVEDTLETPAPGGARAAPSRLPCAASLLGTEFGAAPAEGPRGARHPGRGSHLGPERFSRQRRPRGGV